MSNQKQKIDFRHPELFIALSSNRAASGDFSRASLLGEQYRALKKALKCESDEKKVLSKKVAEAKTINTNASDLISQVKSQSDKILEIKAELKQLEKTIINIVSVAPDMSGVLPPQFSPELSEKAEGEKFTIKAVSEDLHQLWGDYVSQHPNATIYHTLGTQFVISDTFGAQSMSLMAFGEREEVVGVLPLVRLKSKMFGDFWSSVPFFNYGGVLASSQQVSEGLISFAGDMLAHQGGEFIEYRDCRPSQALPVKKDKVAMLLNLPGTEEDLWHQIGSKLRAQIKKAQGYNFKVSTGKLELVDDFYKVFSINMRDLGTPVYSKKFFINMLKQHPSAHITVVYLKERPVSAGFTLGWRNTLEIPWASTLRTANCFNMNMLLYWEILKFSVSSGYIVFDFGRSSVDSATYSFKKQWGAKPYQLYWKYWMPNDGVLPHISPDNPKYRILISIWKKLPILIANFLGPYVVKNLP